MHTLLLNLYGAPCSGKSVKMLQLTALAKIRGLFAEACPEVAKEYVVQNIPITPDIQLALSREQLRRLRCFIGNVRLLITDAPMLIGAFYAQYHRFPTADALLQEFNAARHDLDRRAAKTLNLYLWRNHPYDCAGRYESESQDTDLAQKMYQFVQHHHPPESLLQAQSTDDPESLLEKILSA